MAEESFAAGGSELYARLAREYADDPLVAEICDDHGARWELPLKLFAGVHYLVLSGRVPDAWSNFGGTLRTHTEWLTRFVAEQPIQTNEVQRSWALLPAFLTVAGGCSLDLVELGPSAGLNLGWDRYAYRYGETRWGAADARLELAGDARGGPPPELLDRTARVDGRLGIDRHPVDVTSDEGALLLASFVWADQAHRLERLRAAVHALRENPPELVRGDYVDELPRVLARRRLDRLTVVFHSVSLAYLSRDDRDRVRRILVEDGARGSLAHVSLEFDEERQEAYEAFTLDVRTFPDGEIRRLARVDGHGNRLRWLA